MSDAMELIGKVTAQVEDFLEDEGTKQVTAKELGLDPRAAYKLWATNDCIIVPKSEDRNLQYYGGFEYVDKECRKEVGDYVFYFSEDSRVAGHLDHLVDEDEVK